MSNYVRTTEPEDPVTIDGTLDDIAVPDGADADNYLEATEGVERALNEMRRLADEREEIDAMYRREMDRVEEWYTDRTAGLDDRTAELERQCANWARLLYEADGRKSHSLPQGDIKTRKGSTTVKVVDTDAFGTWAIANGYEEELLEYPAPKPSVNAIKAHAEIVLDDHPDQMVGEVTGYAVHTITGERVPGVLVLHKARTVKVSPR